MQSILQGGSKRDEIIWRRWVLVQRTTKNPLPENNATPRRRPLGPLHQVPHTFGGGQGGADSSGRWLEEFTKWRKDAQRWNISWETTFSCLHELPNFAILKVPKMAFPVPEMKIRDHFYRPNYPPKPRKNHLGNAILYIESGFSAISLFWHIFVPFSECKNA